jgi:sigma-B regulation protein RsbU (phosphoserine phosphatase)
MQREEKTAPLPAESPVRSYPNSIQKLARYFRAVYEDETISTLADELDRDRRLSAVCVVDQDYRPRGIIKRDKLFLLLGKRFGRDLMGERLVREITEGAPVFLGDTNILAVSRSLSAAMREAAAEMENNFIVLRGGEGTFTGMLSFQDLSSYFVDMTNRDITAARLLQERFLASADEIRDARIRVEAWSVPAGGVGGDFYVIKNLGESRFFAALCDVSGKGVSASLVVSMVWGFLRAHPLDRGLGDLLAGLNDSLVNTFHMEKYLTGFFFIHDSQSGVLYLADMGHAHSALIRNGAVSFLEDARVNLPVGVELHIRPAVCRLQVKPGDALLIYTDGITEQDNPEGEEFGDRRFLALAMKSLAAGKKLRELLLPAMESFRKNTPQLDDMSYLFFRF